MFSFFREFIRDIARRKQVKEALRKSEERYRAIFDTTGTATIIVEEDDTISLANSEFEKLSGYPKHETEGKKKWTEFITKDYLEIMKEYHRLRKTDPASAPRTYETRSIDRQGNTRDIMITVNMIPGTKQCVASFSDITKRKQSARALREQSLFLQRLIDNIPNPIFYKDTAGLYRGCNKAYEKFLGLTKHSIIGKSVFDIFPEDLAGKYHKMDEALFQEHGVQVYESSLLDSGGSRRSVIFNKAAYFNTDGSLDGLVCAAVDISERKRVEEKLQAANQQLMDIIDFLPDATLVIDNNGRVIAWNKAIEEMTGVKKEEMLGRGDYAYAVPFYGEPRPILIDLVLMPQKEIEDKYDYIIRSGNTLITETDVPFTYKGKGAVLWGIATPLLDSDGNVIGAVESIRDVTEHKNTVEALRLSEQRFSNIFNASPSLMFISTLEEGRFIEVNHRFLLVTGYSREEIISRTVSDISFWAKPERSEVIKHLREEGKVNNLECVFRQKSGEVYIGLYSAELISFSGEQYILSVVNDISERKRLEEEMARLERLNLIGEMAAGIGHEIRNPMTTVRGFLQMLGEKQECSNFREYYSLMIEEMDRANSIITEYLSLAKNKAVSKQHQNLNHILNALFPLIQADAMRSDMYVHVGLEDIPDLLLDEKEIRQLILNMVRNGLEAMSPGGRISIRTFVRGDDVVLAVQDQGKGIEKDDLEKLGTPFFTTKDTGTGLGLAVCYSIAARHNAAVRVETGPAGTTFYVGFAINQPY